MRKVNFSGWIAFMIMAFVFSACSPFGSDKPSGTNVPTNPAVPSLILNKTSLSLDPGRFERLIATISPSSSSVIWTSSNPSVANVDATGMVWASGAGATAVIRAEHSSDASLSAECTVTVSSDDVRNNADLAGITVSAGTLQPSFDPSTAIYLDAPLPYSNTSEVLTLTAADSRSVVTVNATPVAFNAAYTAAGLDVGPNDFSILVTAPDGATQRSYAVSVYRALPVFKSGAGTISGYPLDPREDGSLQRGVSWPATRFTDNGDGTITDALSGLIWLKANSFAGQYWADSLSYCAGTLAGMSGWRLPNVLEIQSLHHFGMSDTTAWLGTFGFSGLSYGQIWSSTTSQEDTYQAFLVGLSSSAIHLESDSSPSGKQNTSMSTIPVRSVSTNIPSSGQTASYAAGDDGSSQRGIAQPSPRFRANGDGTLTDNMTGLTWLSTSLNYVSWAEALDCEDFLNEDPDANCGFTDWRLPTIKELATLAHYGQAANQTWLNDQGFSGVTQGGYWSSTSSVKNSTKAFILYMNDLSIAFEDKSYFGWGALYLREAR